MIATPPLELPKLVIFDFDGTLVDTKPLYVRACMAYARDKGLTQYNIDNLIKAYGAPDVTGIDLGFDCSNEQKVEHLKHIYELTDSIINGGVHIPPLFEGVRETIEKLYALGCVLALITSRPRPPVEKALIEHRILSYFSSVRSHDDIALFGLRAKPFPDKLISVLQELDIREHEAVFIGDTWMDLAMARKARVKAVGVSWGYGDIDSLSAYTTEILQENMLEFLATQMRKQIA